MIGTLEIYVGPMFAGKTTELVKKALFLQSSQIPILVVKPEFDTRENENVIKTHSGAKIKALRVKNSSSIINNLENTISWVFIDEVQFYDNNLPSIVRSILLKNINVFSTGLDMDYKCEAFSNTAALMAQADKVTKLQAYCSTCGRPASKTLKKMGSEYSLEVGDLNLYEPRCNEHWELYYEIAYKNPG